MVAMPTTTKNILTVSQLNARAQQALEAMGTVWIEGEISNHVRASSGHHYFSLKDANAQVSAAFFRFQANRVRFAVRDRKSTRLNSSHVATSYAVFCLKK